MSDHNRAIHMAQSLLRKQADAFKGVEVGYHLHEPNPLARGYRSAAEALEVLFIPEENITRPSHLDEQTPLDPKPWLIRYGVTRFGMYDTIPSGVRPGELLWQPRDGFEQDRAKYPRGRIGDMRTTDYSRIQVGTVSADRIVPSLDGMSLTAASGPVERGSVTLVIPAALYEQMQRNEPSFSKWGVRISVNEDRSSRIEFPGTTEQHYYTDGIKKIVQLTLREPLPSQAMHMWSFDAAHIVERTGGQQ